MTSPLGSCLASPLPPSNFSFVLYKGISTACCFNLAFLSVACSLSRTVRIIYSSSCLAFGLPEKLFLPFQFPEALINEATQSFTRPRSPKHRAYSTSPVVQTNTPSLHIHHQSGRARFSRRHLPVTMCYLLVERYSACHCLYYQHAVDRCARYGTRGHGITQRTIWVGHACIDHSPPARQQPGHHSSHHHDHDYSDSGYVSGRSSKGSHPSYR